MNYKLLPAQEILEHLQKNLQSIRTGRVSPTLVENLMVEAYGSKMRLMEIATIAAPEARTIVITPYDKGLINDIVTAINIADLGVSPTENGAGVILNFPPLTEENRTQQAKKVDTLAEETRIFMRQKRQDILSKKEKELKDQNASLDAIKSFKDDIQKEIDALNSEIDERVKNKKMEVMKI